MEWEKAAQPRALLPALSQTALTSQLGSTQLLRLSQTTLKL